MLKSFLASVAKDAVPVGDVCGFGCESSWLSCEECRIMSLKRCCISFKVEVSVVSFSEAERLIVLAESSSPWVPVNSCFKSFIKRYKIGHEGWRYYNILESNMAFTRWCLNVDSDYPIVSDWYSCFSAGEVFVWFSSSGLFESILHGSVADMMIGSRVENPG